MTLENLTIFWCIFTHFTINSDCFSGVLNSPSNIPICCKYGLQTNIFDTIVTEIKQKRTSKPEMEKLSESLRYMVYWVYSQWYKGTSKICRQKPHSWWCNPGEKRSWKEQDTDFKAHSVMSPYLVPINWMDNGIANS
jgi:hypothetical protein